VEAAPTWFLWSQPLLVLAVLGLSFAPLREAAAGLRVGPLALAIAVLAPLATALLLPQSAYHFAGHEGTYGSLLLGMQPAMDDLESYGTMPLPLGLSWLLGTLWPSESSQQLWLGLNRLSLGVVILLIAALAAKSAQLRGLEGRGARRAAALAAGLALLCVPLLGWSATAYCVVPALALAAVVLLLGLCAQPSSALLWSALALGTRMELAAVVLTALALTVASGWRRDLAAGGRLRLGVASAGLVMQLSLLASKKARLPVDSFTVDSSIFWENLHNIPLGGTLFSPLVGVSALAVVALVWPGQPGRRVATVLASGFVLALLQPLLLIDVGARHFLPAMLLIVPLLGVALAALLSGREAPAEADAASPGSRPQLSAVALAGLFLALFAALSLRDLADLKWRYVAGQDGYLPRWEAQADQGIRGSVEGVLEPSGCYVVLPGGEETWSGASEGRDVREVHNSALALREGQCVRWGFASEVEFSGSASAERVDRAIHTLGMKPVGWLDPAPSGELPWILFGAGRSDHEPKSGP
jgi:hypothetical protein